MIPYNNIAVFTGPQTINIESKQVPDIPPDYVRIKYLYCGICGGDYSTFLGRRADYPVSLGHEFVGEIIAYGENVHDFYHGQIIISDFNFRCGKCTFCRRGQSHLCVQNDIGLFSNRGFANYGVIHTNYLTAISPPAYLPRACLMEPLSCVIHACESAHVESGMRILLCGGGSLGMLFCFYLCRILGNISIDVCESVETRMHLLESRFPVAEYHNDRRSEYDLIIDCSNTVNGLMFSLSHTPVGGNICVLSHLYGLDTSFVYEQICKKELNCMFPLRNGSHKNLTSAVEYINRFWDNGDDTLLLIYKSISQAFRAKALSPSCKQIINCQHLLP